jgi:hypothetical protein
MGGRYWMTGVQLGMLIAFAKIGNDEEAGKLLDKIAEFQFLGQQDGNGEKNI